MLDKFRGVKRWAWSVPILGLFMFIHTPDNAAASVAQGEYERNHRLAEASFANKNPRLVRYIVQIRVLERVFFRYKDTLINTINATINQYQYEEIAADKQSDRQNANRRFKKVMDLLTGARLQYFDLIINLLELQEENLLSAQSISNTNLIAFRYFQDSLRKMAENAALKDPKDIEILTRLNMKISSSATRTSWSVMLIDMEKTKAQMQEEFRQAYRVIDLMDNINLNTKARAQTYLNATIEIEKRLRRIQNLLSQMDSFVKTQALQLKW